MLVYIVTFVLTLQEIHAYVQKGDALFTPSEELFTRDIRYIAGFS